MKIAHINLFDFQGGAAKVAADIVEEADRLGHESVLFVHRPTHKHPRIIPIPFLGGPYKAFIEPSSKMRVPNIQASALLPVLLHHDFLSADVIHLHCINGGYFSYLLLPFLAVKSLVWTIHDTLAITANCLNAQYCLKWRTEYCEKCPMDESNKNVNNSNKRILLQRAKEDILLTTQFTAVAPSRWIEKLLRTSSFKTQDIRMIYNGVHMDVFLPRNGQEARKMLNLPLDKKIILFVAHGGLKNASKGGRYLLEVLKIAASKREEWFLVEVGGENSKSDAAYPIPGISVAYIKDAAKMALYYAAANVFVSTSVSESFGLTVCEALSCGTPIVAFAAGGVSEIIENGKSGKLVQVGDVKGMFREIRDLMNSPEVSKSISKNARVRAENLFSVKNMAQKYIKLYEEIR